MRTLMAMVACLCLAACALPHRDAPPPDEQLFADARYAPPSERIDARDIFALSPEMRAYLQTQIEPRSFKSGRQSALLDALFTRGQLKLDYDTAMTRNASQAFSARAGNCLSLVIMTAAFAKALDLHVNYQKVLVDDVWTRAGDLYLAIGHVNITMGKRATDEGGFGYRVGRRAFESEGLTVDFLARGDLLRTRTVPIDEGVIVAMYMNNRAVEALAAGRVSDAYWWAREAIVQSRDYLVAYNTLGAIHRQQGEAVRAEAALRFVLAREPDNAQTLANLVTVLNEAGKDAEARAMSATLARLEPEPPFGYFRRGVAALQAGDARAARDLFTKELDRAPDYHELHFWLAVAQGRLGQGEEARRHLAIAMKNSTSREDREIYAAKLGRIEALH
jgi:tetratricopeptide (TPR) repeat protein